MLYTHGARGAPLPADCPIHAGYGPGLDGPTNAGVGDDGPRLYFLDPAGGKLEDEKFAAGGTGESVAYGVLEQGYSDGMGVADGAKLAAQSIAGAIERDVATGDKVMVAVIDGEGYRELPESEVEGLLK